MDLHRSYNLSHTSQPQKVFSNRDNTVQPAFVKPFNSPASALASDTIMFSGKQVAPLPWTDPFSDPHTEAFHSFFKLLQAKTQNTELEWTHRQSSRPIKVTARNKKPFEGEVVVSQYLSSPLTVSKGLSNKPVLLIKNHVNGTDLSWVNMVHFEDATQARFLTSSELDSGITTDAKNMDSLGLNYNSANANELLLFKDINETLIPAIQSNVVLSRPYRDTLSALTLFSRQTQLSQMQWFDHVHYVYKERTSPVTKQVESQQWAIEQYVSRSPFDSDEKGAILIKMYPTQHPDAEQCYYGFIPLSSQQEDALNHHGRSVDVLKQIETAPDLLLIRATQTKPHQQQVAKAIETMLDTINQQESRHPSVALGVPSASAVVTDDVDSLQLCYGHPLLEKGGYYDDATGAHVKSVLLSLKEATEKLNLPWQCKQFPVQYHTEDHNKGDTEEVSQVRLQLNGHSVFIVHRHYKDADGLGGEDDYALMVPMYSYCNFLPLSVIQKKLNNDRYFDADVVQHKTERNSEPNALKMTRKTVVSNYYTGSGLTYIPAPDEGADTVSVLNLEHNKDLVPLFEWFLDRGFNNSSAV